MIAQPELQSLLAQVAEAEAVIGAARANLALSQQQFIDDVDAYARHILQSGADVPVAYVDRLYWDAPWVPVSVIALFLNCAPQEVSGRLPSCSRSIDCPAGCGRIVRVMFSRTYPAGRQEPCSQCLLESGGSDGPASGGEGV